MTDDLLAWFDRELELLGRANVTFRVLGARPSEVILLRTGHRFAIVHCPHCKRRVKVEVIR